METEGSLPFSEGSATGPWPELGAVEIRGPVWHFRKKLDFYGEEFLASCLTPNLEDHHLAAVRDCLLKVFTATFHIWRPSPPSATWGRTMPWWQRPI
jgi:hypothetical protein